MSFFGNKQAVTIASPLQGTITQAGRSKANIKVERELRWSGDDFQETQTAYTNEQGQFSFPEIVEEMTISPLAKLVISQEIHVYPEADRQETVWSVGKGKYERYSEFGGEPLNFTCEINDPDRAVRLDGALIYTRCHWDH